MPKNYRPNITDKDRRIRKRVHKLKKETGLLVSSIEKIVFERGLDAAEKDIKKVNN